MRSKFSLADLFILAGTLAFGFMCFLSFNFLSLGDIKASIVRAIIFALLLGVPAFVAKLLKKTDRPSKAKVIGEMILLSLFTIVAIIAIFPFSHYLAVSSKKTDIQKELAFNIDLAASMFDNYKYYIENRQRMYKNSLDAVVAAKSVSPREYTNYGFVNGTNDNTQIENKMFILKAKLEPSNYEEMKQIASAWLLDAKKTITNWNLTGIGVVDDLMGTGRGIADVVNKVNGNTTFWKNELKQLSEYRAQGETATDFDYHLAFNDVTDKIKTLNSPTLFSIIWAVGLYMFMLLSYFITRRHSKNNYTLRSIFTGKKNNVKNNFDIDY